MNRFRSQPFILFIEKGSGQQKKWDFNRQFFGEVMFGKLFVSWSQISFPMTIRCSILYLRSEDFSDFL